MTQTTSIVLLIGLIIILVGHYVRQKSLLAKGWVAENANPYIKILTLNGGMLLILAVIALIMADWPYGFIGILLFIEAAVCFAFAKKLRNK